MVTALIAFAIMLALIFLRVPIAFAMGLVGFFGFAHILDNYGAARVTRARRAPATSGLLVGVTPIVQTPNSNLRFLWEIPDMIPV